MARINSPAELEEVQKEILSRRDPNKPCITALLRLRLPSPPAAGEVAAAFKEEIEKQGLSRDGGHQGDRLPRILREGSHHGHLP